MLVMDLALRGACLNKDKQLDYKLHIIVRLQSTKLYTTQLSRAAINAL